MKIFSSAGSSTRNSKILYVALSGITIVATVLSFLWFVPQIQGRYFSTGVPASEVPALINDYRQTWAQILGGLALLLGLYLTWRRVDVSQQTLETAQEQQVTERFTRAIDQLGALSEQGAPRLEIRLGGIYALERIARDSEKDYWPIMEVLTAYVRENEPRTSYENKIEGQEPQLLKPEVQAIISILRRSTHRPVPRQGRGLSLERSYLAGSNFSEAYLYNASFDYSSLRLSLFPNANLDRSKFQYADLQGALLNDATISESVFNRAFMFHALMKRVNLSGSIFWKANLEWVTLESADLEHADLENANLKGANLRNASLKNAILTGACLEGTQLHNANLQDTKGLAKEQIEQAHGNLFTHLPIEMPMPDTWHHTEPGIETG
jgi:uncharacterized protein YjbI with pentapeptide repeats